MAEHRVNRQIRAREVLLIDQNGEKRGVVPIQEALTVAQEAGLDLVEVAGNANPPVCKVLDYGKLSYQSKKKKQVAAKGKTELKEISFSMKISDHDIETKMKKARQLVEKGHKLRFNLILRGRERAYADTKGLEQLDKLTARIADICVVEQKSKGMIGNRLYAILSPLKKVAQ
ncbi:translation initiation factor IF-3 [bacterium]|nr:translation initiation factor IF-3 [bacterium]